MIPRPEIPALLDAVVLAGGRSSRLGGEAKAALRYAGESLLARTVAAARTPMQDGTSVRRVVIVGEPPTDFRPPFGVIVTRETPAFGGPAAGIAAGCEALERAAFETSAPPAARVLVLACDMPRVPEAVRALLGSDHPRDGAIAVDDDGHPQYLLGVYRAAALDAAIAAHRASLHGLSVRKLISALELITIAVPSHTADDIDTWADAAEYGIRRGEEAGMTDTEQPHNGTRSGRADPETDAVLADWVERLTAELGLDAADIDVNGILGLAGTAAHAVLRPAAPLTTFIVGYAAGIAVAERTSTPAEAFAQAAAAASALARANEER